MPTRRIILSAFVLVLAACEGADDGELRGVNLQASTDDARKVRLRWTLDGNAEPASYLVLRDGETIAELPGSQRTFDDEEASPGTVEPPQFEATRGTDPAGVRLTWSHPTAAPGQVHTYRVIAQHKGERVESKDVEGRRGTPAILSFAIKRNGEQIASLNGNASRHVDDTPPSGEPSYPRALQLKGLTEGIEIRWEVPISMGPPQFYELVVEHEAGSTEPVYAQGARGGPLPDSYEIYRDGESIAAISATRPLHYLDRGASPGSFTPPNGVLASRGNDDFVELNWEPPTPDPGRQHEYFVAAVYGEKRVSGPTQSEYRRAPKHVGYQINRDGMKLVSLPPYQTTWKDHSALRGPIPPPANIRVEETEDFVAIRWDPPELSHGRPYEYQVAALYAGSDPVFSSSVEGYIGYPQILYYIWEHDGAQLAIDKRYSGVLDDLASPGTVTFPSNFQASTDLLEGIRLTWEPGKSEPGPTKRYRLKVVTSQGESDWSEEVTGARAAPTFSLRIETAGPKPRMFFPSNDETTYLDTGASPGHLAAPVLLSASNDHDDHIEILWSPAQEVPGPSTEYILKVIRGWSATTAGTAVGARRAPEVLAYVIERDGAPIGSVEGTSTSFIDEEVAPVGPPASLTTLSYFDAVVLNWTAPQEGAQYSYAVKALHEDGGESTSNALTGTRNPHPVISYEFSRDDGATWHPAGSSTTYSDTEAVYGSISSSQQVRFLDPTGEVELRKGFVDTVNPPPSSPYRVRAVTALGPGVPSAAKAGRRNVSQSGVVSWWQASPTGEEGSYVDLNVPCCVGSGGVLEIGEERWYRLVQEAPGAYTEHPPIRMVRKGFRSIDVARNHGCGLWTDGQLRCWGEYFDIASPSDKVPTEVGPFTLVATGTDTTAGVRTTGALFWHGPDFPIHKPVSPLVDEAYTKIAIGYDHACGIRSANHRLRCSGNNQHAKATPPSPQFLDISVGRDFSCGIEFGGALNCWGLVPPGAPAGSFERVAVGQNHGCVLGGGTLTCWGSDPSGNTNPPPGSNFVEVRARDNSTCALTTGGTIECWGVLSDPPEPGPFIDLSVGGTYACAVKETGEVLCWGSGIPSPGN